MPSDRTRHRLVDPDRLAAAGYLHRVLVKFRRAPGHVYEDGVERRFTGALLALWNSVSAGRSELTLARMFPEPDPDAISAAVEDAAHASPDYHPPDFFSCYAIDCPRDVDARELARRLSATPEVERAYVQGLPAPPPGFPKVADYSSEPYFTHQGYLHDAPEGIGARAAWALPGGDGSGVRFVDVEQGWRLAHEDLPQQPRIAMLPPKRSVSYASQRHGTSVLGVVLGVPDRAGIVGIAPGVRGQVVSEWWLAYSPPGFPLANHSPSRAFFFGACLLGRGDVLLLESQAHVDKGGGVEWFQPAESDFFSLLAIQFATARGITVVEPAGNGIYGSASAGPTGLDLDAGAFAGAFDRAQLDSGAIVVAATKWVPPSGSAPGYHAWVEETNHGSRVDCFAWGGGVVTLAEPDDPPEPTASGVLLDAGYTTDFELTSSASAIIAGACAAVQGISRWKRGAPLSVAKLRSILSDPAYGTRAFTGPPGTAGGAVDLTVGVMPNLTRILDYFGL